MYGTSPVASIMDSTKFDAGLIGVLASVDADRLTNYNAIVSSSSKQLLGLMYVLTQYAFNYAPESK